MKKFIIFNILIFFVLQLSFSQSKSNIADNYISQIAGKLDKAKEAIDKDCIDIKKKAEAETWYLKGYIYTEIAKTEVYKSLCNNPSFDALDAIKKCKQLDSENILYSECLNVLFDISTIFYDKGIKLYNSGINNKNIEHFKEALAEFQMFFETLETLGNDEKIIKHLLEFNDINSNSVIIYAGYSAQSIGDYNKAKEYYLKLIDLKSDISTARKKGLALAYIYYSDILIAEGKSSEAIIIVERGTELFLDNTDLIISCINLLFQENRTDELSDILELAIKNKPRDIKLLTVLAGTYNKISKQYIKRGYHETADKYRAKSIETYNKAIALNPSDNDLLFKINYNCGLLYYNRGVRLYIKHDESNTEEWTKLFNSSLPYLTKAHKYQTSNKKLINILMKIYQCLNETDKAKEMEEKLY